MSSPTEFTVGQSVSLSEAVELVPPRCSQKRVCGGQGAILRLASSKQEGACCCCRNHPGDPSQYWEFPS